MTGQSYTAIAHPNIAFIKYWGNSDPNLRLPRNGSISLTLGELSTKTRVEFDRKLTADQVMINNEPASEPTQIRVAAHLDRVRQEAGIGLKARVRSISNFPISAGLASSASAFAALTLAAAKASGLNLAPQALSILARKGSGSACRSIFGGYVEWLLADSDDQSYAIQIADEHHWELYDVIAIVQEQAKLIGSTEGHDSAKTSVLQTTRVKDANRRLEICRRSILDRDFNALSEISELDSNMMHAVMITSIPPILYWNPATLTIMQRVREWRSDGLQVFYTIDAGPNVHCICMSDSVHEVETRLRKVPGVKRILTSKPGGPVRLA